MPKLRVPHLRRSSETPAADGLTDDLMEVHEALDEACRSEGCANRAEARCAYVDRSRCACNTAWCREHLTVVVGLPYCRRHAAVAPSLSNGFFHHLLPTVDNRAPSLVSWVGSQLDGEIRAALTEVAPHKQSRVVSGPVQPEPTRGGTLQRWFRTWSLVDDAGTLAGVMLEVDEEDEPEVGVRVGGQLLGRLRPPWVGRGRNKPVATEQDAVERQTFNDAIMRAVELGLARHMRTQAAEMLRVHEESEVAS